MFAKHFDIVHLKEGHRLLLLKDIPICAHVVWPPSTSPETEQIMISVSKYARIGYILN